MTSQITLEDMMKVNPKLSVEFKTQKHPEIKKRIISKYGNYENFSKTMGISRSFLIQILNRKKNPGVILARRMAETLDFESEDIMCKLFVKYRSSGSYIPIESFPIKFTPETASLLGHSLGDGYVGSTFSYTNLSEAVIKDTLNSIATLPVKEMTLNKRFHRALTIRPSSLVKDILVGAGAPKGNKTLQKIYTPTWIMNGSREFKKKFLQAIFDDEGCVTINKREITLTMAKNIRFEANLKEFLLEIRTLLKDVGIEGTTITLNRQYRGKNGNSISYTLRVCGSENFIKFKENVNFLHNKKRQFLNKMIDNTKRIKLSKEKRDEIIIIKLKERPMLTALEISKLAKMTHIGTIDKLRDMRKRRLLIRHGKYNSKWEAK